MPFPDQLDAATFHSLSLCRTADGWQAALEVASGAFRIRVGAVPSAALEALFGQEAHSSLPPPLPY